MKKQYIRDLAVDMEVDSVFRIVSYHIKDTKAGQRFLALGLADRTGRISAKRWDIPDGEVEIGRAMRYVRVQGVVEDYRGARQLRLDQPIEDAGGEYDPADYEAVAPLKLGELQRRLDALVDDVREPRLRVILNAFFGDPKFRARFDDAPAAKGLHHASRHGLLQHTVEVAEMTRAIADLQSTWGYPAVSSDLAVAGALLHDIGKTRELDWSEPSYAYTPTGNLLGHIAIGYQMVFTKINQVGGFPTALRDALLHIVLSHHGKLEHGSPVTPMLREALIVTMADDLDARLFCMTAAAEEFQEKAFGWHRAVEGGRVYAGSLGLTPESGEPAPTVDERQSVAAHADAERQLNADPAAAGDTASEKPLRQAALDLHNPAAAILRSVGNGQGRYRRRPGG